MPEAHGVPEAGFDNFQVHNRALTLEEIKSSVAGDLTDRGRMRWGAVREASCAAVQWSLAV